MSTNAINDVIVELAFENAFSIKHVWKISLEGVISLEGSMTVVK